MKTKCAILEQCNSPLKIKEVEIPILKEGQVLVKILFSGICHSQLNEIKGLNGEDKFLPHLLGHEGSGIVEEIGPLVTKVAKSDYVVLSWIKGNGLDCPSSRYFCDNKSINSGAISTFSQYAVISENRLVKILSSLPPQVAALLGCAIPTGAGMIKNQININSKHTVAIFGVGGIGLSALLYATSQGVSTIIAVDINQKKLLLAKELGASHIINAHTHNTLEEIQKITNGNGVDFALEATGVKGAMESAYASIKDQGNVILAGNLKKGETICIDPFGLIKGKKIVGSWGGNSNPEIDIPYYVQLCLQQKLRAEKLISRIYPLTEINQAFADLEAGEVIRALIDCQK